MHDGVDALFDKYLVEAMRLVEIADDEPLGRHRAAMAQRETIVHPHVVATIEEQADGVAADITGAADDNNSHRHQGSVGP